MCVDEVKADSVFLCPQTAGSAIVELADAVITDVDMESTEILCTRNSITSSQIVTQITNTRRMIRLSMAFLCVAVFSILLSNFYTAEHTAEISQLSVRTAVLKFIHNTDGKK